MRDCIRWFKYKLKPPKNFGECGIRVEQSSLLKKWIYVINVARLWWVLGVEFWQAGFFLLSYPRWQHASAR